jgi:hypothetical protein
MTNELVAGLPAGDFELAVRHNQDAQRTPRGAWVSMGKCNDSVVGDYRCICVDGQAVAFVARWHLMAILFGKSYDQ